MPYQIDFWGGELHQKHVAEYYTDDWSDAQTQMQRAVDAGLLCNVLHTDFKCPPQQVEAQKLALADFCLEVLTMQRKDVERMCACAPFADQTAGIPEMVAALRALLDRAERAEAERDAAFEAGQIDMRERAARKVISGVTTDIQRDIRALAIKPRP